MANSEALDRLALIKIYKAYNTKLFRYAYRLLGDEDIAEECVAETFSRFLAYMKRNPKGPEYVQAYLYRMAHNWITDYYRRQPPTTIALHEAVSDRWNGNPAIQFDEQFEIDRVREAILSLTVDQQQVIALRFLEGLSHEEVAAVLEKSSEATRAIQYRALTALRELLLVPEEV